MYHALQDLRSNQHNVDGNEVLYPLNHAIFLVMDVKIWITKLIC